MHLIKEEKRFLQEAENINKQLSGAIRIGTPNSLLIGFVSYLVNFFTKKYQDTDLTIEETTMANAAKSLQDNSVDIAFVSDAFSSNCKFFPLFTDRICLAVHKLNPLAQFDRIPTDSLKVTPLISNIQGWDDITRIVLDKLDFVPNIKYYSASDFASLAMVQSNLGVYIVSRLQKNILPRDVIMKDFEGNFTRIVGVAIKSVNAATTIQKEFINMARDAFSDKLKIQDFQNFKMKKEKPLR